MPHNQINGTFSAQLMEVSWQAVFGDLLPPSGSRLKVPLANLKHDGGTEVGGLRCASPVVNNLLTSVCDHVGVCDLWPLRAQLFHLGVNLAAPSADWHPAFLTPVPSTETPVSTVHTHAAVASKGRRVLLHVSITVTPHSKTGLISCLFGD